MLRFQFERLFSLTLLPLDGPDWGVIENNYTDVEFPPPPYTPRVCMSIHPEGKSRLISVECLFSMTQRWTDIIFSPPPPRVCISTLKVSHPEGKSCSTSFECFLSRPFCKDNVLRFSTIDKSLPFLGEHELPKKAEVGPTSSCSKCPSACLPTLVLLS